MSSSHGRSGAEGALGPIRFPLQKRFFVIGMALALPVGLALGSAVAGFAVLVLFLAVGSTWIAGEVPVFPTVLAFQWMAIVSGYFYHEVVGVYPGFTAVGDLQTAVVLSLAAQLALVVGIRLAIRVMEPAAIRRKHRTQATPEYDPRRLFVVVIAVYAADWLVEISPMEISFSSAQFLYAVLDFKAVLLLLLFLTVVQQQRHYRFALLAALFVLVPALSSTASAFSGVFFLFFLALLTAWRPWKEAGSERRRNRWVLAAAISVALATILLGLLWEGGIKSSWRSSVRSSIVAGSPIDRAQEFAALARREAPQIDLAAAYPELIRRLSSEVGFFSFVRERVPAVVPHSDGELTMRAVRHVSMPRLLFPEKPNLGGDSWLVRTYAGVPAAGDEQGTSIGLGYIPEFYIDFGVPLMFVPLLLLGFVVGLCYRTPLLVSPSHTLYVSAVTSLIFSIMLGYGGEIAKVLGALIMKTGIFGLILMTAGPALHRALLGPAGGAARAGARTDDDWHLVGGRPERFVRGHGR